MAETDDAGSKDNYIRVRTIHVFTVLTLAFIGLLGLLYQEVKEIRDEFATLNSTVYDVNGRMDLLSNVTYKLVADNVSDSQEVTP